MDGVGETELYVVLDMYVHIGRLQGLGKTLQTISLLACLHLELPANKDKEQGPSLVLCPTAIVDVWMAEMARWWVCCFVCPS